MFNPIVFDERACDGCNVCVNVCLMEILEASPQKGRPPIVKYPDECAFDGACWMLCHARDKGAIRVVPPLPMRVSIMRGEKNE